MSHMLKEQHTLKGHEGRVWCVTWSPDGKWLATCGEDRTIRIWGQSEVEGWSCVSVLTEGHDRTVRSVAWSPCGKYLAAASFDATISIWNRKGGQFDCTNTLEGHENEVKDVGWSVSGNYLASCSRDKSVFVWEMEADDEFECAATLTAHTQDVKRIVWHPHIDLLASASYDNMIKIFKDDNDDWICCGTLKGHENTVWSIDFDADGKRLVSSSADETVRIWKEYLPGNAQGIPTHDNDPAWKCVCTLSGYHTRAIYDVSWCHSTGLIATACGDNGLRIFQEENNGNEHEPTFNMIASVEQAHEQDVNSVAWNPKVSGLLASAGDDELVKLWLAVV